MAERKFILTVELHNGEIERQAADMGKLISNAINAHLKLNLDALGLPSGGTMSAPDMTKFNAAVDAMAAKIAELSANMGKVAKETTGGQRKADSPTQLSTPPPAKHAPIVTDYTDSYGAARFGRTSIGNLVIPHNPQLQRDIDQSHRDAVRAGVRISRTLEDVANDIHKAAAKASDASFAIQRITGAGSKPQGAYRAEHTALAAIMRATPSDEEILKRMALERKQEQARLLAAIDSSRKMAEARASEIAEYERDVRKKQELDAAWYATQYKRGIKSVGDAISVGTREVKQRASDDAKMAEARIAEEVRVQEAKIRLRADAAEKARNDELAQVDDLQRVLALRRKANMEELKEDNKRLAKAVAFTEKSAGKANASADVDAAKLLALQSATERVAAFSGHDIGYIQKLYGTPQDIMKTAKAVDELNRMVQNGLMTQKELDAAKARFGSGAETLVKPTGHADKAVQAAFGGVNNAHLLMSNMKNSGIRTFITEIETLMKFQLRWYAGMGVIFGTLGALKQATVQALEFSQTMQNIAAVAGQGDIAATASYIRVLGDASLELSENLPLAASEIAKIGLQVARAGLPMEQTSAAMEMAAKIAVVSGEDISAVAKTVVTSITAFGLAGKDSERVGNVLAGGLNLSKLTIQDMGTALNYLGGTAHSFNKNFEEVIATMSVFSNAGMSASTIGTSVTQMMVQMAIPTAKVKDLLHGVGLKIDDVDPRFNTLAATLRKLEEHNVSAAAAMEAFGMRGGRALAYGIGLGPEKFEEMEKRLKEMAYLENSLAEVRKGPQAAFEELANTWQSGISRAVLVATPIITAFSDLLKGLGKAVSAIVSGFAWLAEKLPTWALTIAATALPIAWAIRKIRAEGEALKLALAFLTPGGWAAGLFKFAASLAAIGAAGYAAKKIAGGDEDAIDYDKMVKRQAELKGEVAETADEAERFKRNITEALEQAQGAKWNIPSFMVTAPGVDRFKLTDDADKRVKAAEKKVREAEDALKAQETKLEKFGYSSSDISRMSGLQPLKTNISDAKYELGVATKSKENRAKLLGAEAVGMTSKAWATFKAGIEATSQKTPAEMLETMREYIQPVLMEALSKGGDAYRAAWGKLIDDGTIGVMMSLMKDQKDRPVKIAGIVSDTEIATINSQLAAYKQQLESYKITDDAFIEYEIDAEVKKRDRKVKVLESQKEAIEGTDALAKAERAKIDGEIANTTRDAATAIAALNWKQASLNRKRTLQQEEHGLALGAIAQSKTSAEAMAEIEIKRSAVQRQFDKGKISEAEKLKADWVAETDSLSVAIGDAWAEYQRKVKEEKANFAGSGDTSEVSQKNHAATLERLKKEYDKTWAALAIGWRKYSATASAALDAIPEKMGIVVREHKLAMDSIQRQMSDAAANGAFDLADDDRTRRFERGQIDEIARLQEELDAAQERGTARLFAAASSATSERASVENKYTGQTAPDKIADRDREIAAINARAQLAIAEIENDTNRAVLGIEGKLTDANASISDGMLKGFAQFTAAIGRKADAAMRLASAMSDAFKSNLSQGMYDFISGDAARHNGDVKEQLRLLDEEYKKAKANRNAQNPSGGMTDQEYQARRAKLKSELTTLGTYAKNFMRSILKAITDEIAGGIAKMLLSPVMDALKGGDTKAKEAAATAGLITANTGLITSNELVTASVWDMTAAYTALNIARMGAGGIGEPTFSGTEAVAHNGWDYVRKYHHGGLATDEVPAVLQTGERVLTRSQNAIFERMASSLDSGGSSPSVSINIENKTGAQVNAQQTNVSFDRQSRSYVLGVVLEAAATSPSFRNGLQSNLASGRS